MCKKKRRRKDKISIFHESLSMKAANNKRPIGSKMEREVFDELLLIEIMATIIKYLEENYSNMKRTVVDRAVERDP